MNKWYTISNREKEIAYRQVADELGLPVHVIEKDWWVVQTLSLVFQTEIGSHLVFKGGTSLSKSWNIIHRFSEDVDLAVNRDFFGFSGVLNKSQRTKLRKISAQYLIQEFVPALKLKFEEQGMKDVLVKIIPTTETDQDPKLIEIFYPAVVSYSEYIKPRVLLEIGCRSLIEPFTQKKVTSFLDDHFVNASFKEEPVEIASVNPERTFLEKIFLLHEEFQKPDARSERMSRHLYDIYKLLQIKECKESIENNALIQTIIEHRKRYTKISGVDYAKHQPEFIRFIPPASKLDAYRRDYNTMLEHMIHEDTALSFEEVILVLKEFNARINKI